MRARPLIAVTTSELRRPEDVVARPQGEPPKLEVALATLYPEAIERAGGVPVIVPLLRPEAVAALLDRVDGVCLPGGPDLQPSAYGEEPHPELGADRAAGGCGRAGARAGRRPAEAPDPGYLPRDAGPERGPRRDASPAPPGRRRRPAPASPARARQHRHPPRRDRAAQPARGPPWAGRSSRSTRSTTRPSDALGKTWRRPPGPRTGRSRRSRSPASGWSSGVQWHAEGLRAHAPLFDAADRSRRRGPTNSHPSRGASRRRVGRPAPAGPATRSGWPGPRAESRAAGHTLNPRAVRSVVNCTPRER